MFQFHIPEVVSVEQVFDKSDEVNVKEFEKLEENHEKESDENLSNVRDVSINRMCFYCH